MISVVVAGLVFLVAVGPSVVAAQSGGLRIVVLEGEDAVNIVQQKTAVAPVVEVRDRNDQPVAGAVVRFAVRSGRATFNGSRTLTVTTNAAGRAAVSGLTPTGTGVLQISADAVFQGQTAAVTITQRNVATAAQAATVSSGAGGAGSAGGAAAGGVAAGGAATGGAATGGGTAVAAAGGAAAAAGGLSGVTIAAIAGGAGVGALLAAEKAGLIGGGGSSGGKCSYTLDQSTFSVPSAGGDFTVTMTANNDTCDVQFFEIENNPSNFFAPAGSNASTISGRVVTVLFHANFNTPGGPPRSGTLLVAGNPITVNQAAACAFSANPPSFTFPRSGGSGVLSVIGSPSGCDTPWTASVGTSSLVSITPTAGAGSGTIIVTVSPAPGMLMNFAANISISPPALLVPVTYVAP